jgi:hypothetical protein
MCLKHGTALRGTSLATSGHNVWADSLPHELRGQQLLRRPLSAFDRELAARSVAVLNRPAGEQLDRDGHWYRRRLLELGMLSEGRQVNVDKLKVWFRTSGVASPAHYGFSMKSWELSWLAFLLRPGSNQPHIPLKHLLLETALALQAPVTEPLVEHVPKGPSGRDTARRDKEYAAAVQKVVAAYVRRGERLRVSDVLTQVGCFGSFRHAWRL